MKKSAPHIDILKRHIFVTGLPRSGSTLVCQLLGHHPDIYSTGHSSPLSHTINGMRARWSNDAFLLSQLDVDFDLAYNRLLNGYRGFMNGWFAETDKPVVVDKNRSWLGSIDAALQIDPKAKFVVCLRELGQLFGSIEAQHQKTVLLDSGDNTANMTPHGRATAYFKEGGMVASCLANVESALEDLDDSYKAHLFFLRFEDLMQDPTDTMEKLWTFLDLPKHEIDFNNLQVKPHESDSHYKFKFRHRTQSALKTIGEHRIPARTQKGLQGQHTWFYKIFYPQYLKARRP